MELHCVEYIIGITIAGKGNSAKSYKNKITFYIKIKGDIYLLLDNNKFWFRFS